MVVLLWVFCFAISAFAGAIEAKSGSYGFLVIWDMLLLVGFSVGGTMILRNVRERGGGHSGQQEGDGGDVAAASCGNAAGNSLARCPPRRWSCGVLARAARA